MFASNSSTTIRIPSDAIFCSTIAATALVNTVSIAWVSTADSAVVSVLSSVLMPASMPRMLAPSLGV